MKTFKCFFLLPILLILNFHNCNSQKTENVSTVDTINAVRGDWVVIRIMSEPQSLNPILAADVESDEIDNYIYESLNSIDAESYELIPQLAELPIVSDDHLTYTYHLKKTNKFSDGHSLTGVDVVFTIKALKNPFIEDAALRYYYLNIKSAEVDPDDPYTVKINLLNPSWKGIYELSLLKICPKHILDPSGLTDKITWNEMGDRNLAKRNSDIQKFADFFNSEDVSFNPKYLIGSGPYELEKWEKNIVINLKRNDNYNGGVPSYPDKLEFKVIQDNSQAVVYAKNKEIDVMYVINPVDFYQNLNNPQEFNLVKAEPVEMVYSYLAWNELNPLFQDKNVRLALSYCVDREKIINEVLLGGAVSIQSPVFYMNKKYLNSDLPVITYELEKAKKLFNDAGWNLNSNGFLEKEINGKKTEFKFTFLSNINLIRKNIVLMIIDDLKNVGIQADILVKDWSIYLDKTKKKNYDATYGTWLLSISPDDPYTIWHSSQASGEGANYVNFINTESDQLIEQYRSEFDESKRIEILKKWQKLIYDEQPYTFLWSTKGRYIYNDRFKNVRWYCKSPCPNYNEWWVPKDKQKYK